MNLLILCPCYYSKYNNNIDKKYIRWIIKIIYNCFLLFTIESWKYDNRNEIHIYIYEWIKKLTETKQNRILLSPVGLFFFLLPPSHIRTGTFVTPNSFSWVRERTSMGRQVYTFQLSLSPLCCSPSWSRDSFIA